ncbi:hypothetical protein [Saccharothrix obliqua]|uniref:hypothetical protein n=1 Tax=Saccharothrix obliqua TaxID=2861747 RepID=UPI001C5CE2E1|nr:hypothetical protein [Saccharothrix obliqua]MBW4718002.1 hypothetical protein [Saccharothrix obliqua]
MRDRVNGVKALLLRLYRYTGVRGLILLGVALLLGTILVASGGFEPFGRSSGTLGTFSMAIGALVVIAVGAAQYRRSSATVGHEEVVVPLLRSEAKFCLILRPFGQDAHVVLPKVGAKRRVGGGTPFTPNVTLEQVVTTAARAVGDMKTYGIVDQRTVFAPPGPVLMRAADDEWQSVARNLIRRAAVIVLVLPPDREFGDGFLWEIEQIRRYDRTSRVVVVVPPGSGAEAHEEALRRACVLMAMLDGEPDRFRVHEYELLFPPTTMVIRCTADGVRWWETQDEPVERTMLGRKRKRVFADATYREVLEVAMREIDHEAN